MGRSNIGSAEHTPRRIIPQRGQVAENDIEASTNDCWAVLQEHEAGSNDTGHADNFAPQAGSGAVADARAFASAGYILAREARCEAIHSASPRGWIEQPHVSFVHRQVGKSLAQDGAAIGVPLDGADGAVSKNEICEKTATGSGE
jgi:hypothetical protein